MPDIDPAALSRPAAASLSTPVLSSKTIASSAPGSQKAPKASQIIPIRIELEPLYTVLKSAIGNEQWVTYKETMAEFLLGRLSQNEYSSRIGPILSTPEKDHLHNQLVAAIYGNVTREMPDPGLAPWVSANDKPVTAPAPKPVTGDATERRLKGEVMQLPSRDRRRIKDLVHNEYGCSQESSTNAFGDPTRRQSRNTDAMPQPGINNMNLDLEIRKRFNQNLAVESGEFPDVASIENRMLPFCYENGLTNGHAPDASHLVTLATELFLKETLAGIFSRVRCNAPGEASTAGFGMGTTWIQTHRYKHQLAKEEDAAARGDATRDKGGFLPVEAKAASERGPLGMSDLRVALEISESGMSRFPALRVSILNGYREGELENWDDYTWLPGQEPPPASIGPLKVNGITTKECHAAAINGHPDPMEIDSEIAWEGVDGPDLLGLDSILDSCLTATS